MDGRKQTEVLNHSIFRKGEIKVLTELQILFVDTVTTICATEHNMGKADYRYCLFEFRISK